MCEIFRKLLNKFQSLSGQVLTRFRNCEKRQFMRRRASQKKLEPLGQVLQKILKKRRVPVDMEEKRLLSLWNRAVGPQIAAQTRPRYIKGKTLFVDVTTSVWMHQLHFLKADIIRQCNSLAQKAAIRNIFFSVGEIACPLSSPPETPSAQSVSRVLKKRDRRMIDSCTECIADEELREIVKRVMTREITRRRMMEAGKVR